MRRDPCPTSGSSRECQWQYRGVMLPQCWARLDWLSGYFHFFLVHYYYLFFYFYLSCFFFFLSYLCFFGVPMFCLFSPCLFTCAVVLVFLCLFPHSFYFSLFLGAVYFYLCIIFTFSCISLSLFSNPVLFSCIPFFIRYYAYIILYLCKRSVLV